MIPTRLLKICRHNFSQYDSALVYCMPSHALIWKYSRTMQTLDAHISVTET